MGEFKAHTIMGHQEAPSTSKSMNEPAGRSCGERDPAAGLRVLALEPYYVLSHRAFLEGYARFSRHRVSIWNLPGRKWKWRMRGSAFHFAHLAREQPREEAPDLVLASDFLNLADWYAQAPRGWRDAPAILYFHENQITYPLGAGAPPEHFYGWINLSSALAADRILFNSAYHREAFLGELGRVLARMPDFVPPGLQAHLLEHSSVFPVGIDFTPHRDILAQPAPARSDPVIVWNHRWEYDKGPELMAETLTHLKATGARFRAIICGQSFKTSPPVFAELPQRLGPHLEHLGFFADSSSYLRALQRADIVLSTARHEFFGVAVVEALFMGALPLLPRALSYPEIIPAPLHAAFLYDEPEHLVTRLRTLLEAPPQQHREELQRVAQQFDWRTLAPRLDAVVAETCRQGRR